jgi:hypothetical protein
LNKRVRSLSVVGVLCVLGACGGGGGTGNTDGAAGATGSAGATGMAGATGSAGTSGTAGTTETAGSTGTGGATAGTTGAAGSTGTGGATAGTTGNTDGGAGAAGTRADGSADATSGTDAASDPCHPAKVMSACSRGSSCTEYYGSFYTDTIVHNSCNTGSGTLLATCPTTDNYLGHCVPATNPTLAAATFSYGAPSQLNSYKLSCTGGGGTWCPAP